MTPIQSCEIEVSRFFDKYYKFCASSNADDLRDVLSTLCSSCEKFEKVRKINLGRNKAYIALKALRNFATHESELLNTSKAISLKSVPAIHAEVQIMCLIPLPTMEYILKNLKSNYTKKSMRTNAIFYGKYVDIYPMLFNFTVDLFLLSVKENLSINGYGFSSLKKSIEYEVANGFPHHINGKVVMLDGSNIDDFLDKATISIADKSIEKS